MSRGLRILLADDEALGRRRLSRLLSAHPRVDGIRECEDGTMVLRELEREPVDLLLLDIHMPGLDGIATKALLGDPQPPVIFVTAHPEHAVRAFDLEAFDYLLKPVEPQRLFRAIERLLTRLDAANAASVRADAPLERLVVVTQKGVRLLPIEAITHATLDGELVTIHTADESLLTDQSLQQVATRLPATTFERVHRRVLLNLTKVDRLVPTPSGGYLAVLMTGVHVEVSRQSARNLRKRLGIA